MMVSGETYVTLLVENRLEDFTKKDALQWQS